MGEISLPVFWFFVTIVILLLVQIFFALFSFTAGYNHAIEKLHKELANNAKGKDFHLEESTGTASVKVYFQDFSKVKKVEIVKI